MVERRRMRGRDLSVYVALVTLVIVLAVIWLNLGEALSDTVLSHVRELTLTFAAVTGILSGLTWVRRNHHLLHSQPASASAESFMRATMFRVANYGAYFYASLTVLSVVVRGGFAAVGLDEGAILAITLVVILLLTLSLFGAVQITIDFWREWRRIPEPAG